MFFERRKERKKKKRKKGNSNMLRGSHANPHVILVLGPLATLFSLSQLTTSVTLTTRLSVPEARS